MTHRFDRQDAGRLLRGDQWLRRALAAEADADRLAALVADLDDLPAVAEALRLHAEARAIRAAVYPPITPPP
jgi:hypothetical protein